MTLPVITKKTKTKPESVENGFLLFIDKQPDWTSFDVCKKVKSITGIKKVGHAGTLDPFATGLLILGLGKGTKSLNVIVDSYKTYFAKIKFGEDTDSYDRTGNTVHVRHDFDLSLKKIEPAIKAMSGEIFQTVPMFSAKKIQGKRLYKLARKGIEVTREPKKVEVRDYKIIAWEKPFLSLRLTVSKGTYVRSYAHDLGQMLKIPAHLFELRRLSIADYNVDDAFSINEFEQVWTDIWKQDVYH